jgi:hypothetical protein
MSLFGFLFIFLIGLIILLSNIYNSKKSGTLRKGDDMYFPKAYLYILDSLIGFILILIAFGVL